MVISQIIKQLEEIKQKYGDLPVVGSSDEEQNCLGDVFDIQCGKLTEYDQYVNSTVKVGDTIVVIVPAM
jgi:co-chaperonin GroES (HSP10)